MEQFQARNTVRRRPMYKTLFTALAVLLICSVGFAAAVNYPTIKSWLVQVEINGEVTEVELTQTAPDQPAAASFTVDTDDGEAQVSIQRWDNPDGEQGMQVHVVRDGEDGDAIETMDTVVRRAMVDGQAENYTLEDIGDADPAAQWQDENDHDWKLYIVYGNDGEDASLYTVMSADGQGPIVHRAGLLHSSLLTEGIEPAVEVDGDGLITLTFDDGENVNVMKIKSQVSAHEIDDLNTLRVGPDCGDAGFIRVRVEEIDDE